MHVIGCITDLVGTAGVHWRSWLVKLMLLSGKDDRLLLPQPACQSSRPSPLVADTRMTVQRGFTW